MRDSTRNLIVAGAVIVVAVVALGSYLDNQKKQQIARAKTEYFSLCTQKSDALLESVQEREVTAVVEKAGLDGEMFRVGMISPVDGRAALEKAGLLGEFAAAVERQKQIVVEGERRQQECEKKQSSAKDFLQRNNALPVSP